MHCCFLMLSEYMQLQPAGVQVRIFHLGEEKKNVIHSRLLCVWLRVLLFGGFPQRTWISPDRGFSTVVFPEEICIS